MGVFDSARTSERVLEITGVGVNVVKFCGLDVTIDIGLRLVVGLITVRALLAATAADNIGSAFTTVEVDGLGVAFASGFRFFCGVNVVLGLDTVDWMIEDAFGAIFIDCDGLATVPVLKVMVLVGVGTATGVLDTGVLATGVEDRTPVEPPIDTVAGFAPPS
jgi:hypothetical protein